MKQKISLIIIMVVLFSGLSLQGFAGEMKITADLELFYERSDDVGGPGDNDRFATNQLYLTFDGELEEWLSARLKLDGADVVSSDGSTVTEKIIEEANFTMKPAADIPLKVIFGKDEMPYGLDYDKYLNDSIAHAFEIDKVWGFHFVYSLEGFGDIAAAMYEHRNGSAENEVTDNYTARVKIDELLKDVTFEVSYANEKYTNDDETKYSIGLIYDFIDSANINIEYNGVQNRKGTMDYDPALLTTGLEYNYQSFVFFGRYEKIFEDAASDVEEDFYMGGIAYSPEKNYRFSIEVANFNSVNLKDASDLNVSKNSLENAVIFGIRAKF